MKRKISIIICILVASLGTALVVNMNKSNPYKDKNTLYYKEFENEVLRFERYDYSLGQNQLVRVQRTTNKGKSFENVTVDNITVSMEPKFVFFNNKLGFVIAKDNLTKSNNYVGVKVTQDGGKTFVNGRFNYDNPNIEIITVEDIPYYENNQLKLKCSIYQVKEDNSGYEDVELIFVSSDEGLTWNLSNN